MLLQSERRALDDFDRTVPNHRTGYVQNRKEAEIGDPVITLQPARKHRGAESHECDRQDESEDEDPCMFSCNTGYSEYVVERHRDVGDDDLRHRASYRFSGYHRRAAMNAGRA